MISEGPGVQGQAQALVELQIMSHAEKTSHLHGGREELSTGGSLGESKWPPSSLFPGALMVTVPGHEMERFVWQRHADVSVCNDLVMSEADLAFPSKLF